MAQSASCIRCASAPGVDGDRCWESLYLLLKVRMPDINDKEKLSLRGPTTPEASGGLAPIVIERLPLV
jgi:hypothetical protein